MKVKIFSDFDSQVLTNIVNEFLKYHSVKIKHFTQTITVLNAQKTKITITIFYEEQGGTDQ